MTDRAPAPIALGVVPTGNLLARSTILNLLGFAIPLGAAVLAVPPILAALGADRFGMLALAWALVGYLSFLDLGLGQSLVRGLALAFADASQSRASAVMGSALLAFVIVALIAGVAAFLLASFMVTELVRVPAELRGEASRAFQLIALIVPAVILSAGLTSALEAQYRFDLSNAVGIALGTFNFVGPLIALQFTNDLTIVIAFLAAGRIAATILLCIFVWRTMPSICRHLTIDWSELRHMASFGGWVTVSRIVTPLIGYFDRFAIATLLSLKSLTNYALPFEIASRFSIIPTSVAKVLLPTISLRSGQGGDVVGNLFLRGVKFTLVVVFPCALFIVLFAAPGLELWLGADLARESIPVLQLIMIGLFINAHSYPAVSLLQGMGRPDLSAKIQLCQVPLYLLAAWHFVPIYGIVGAAAISTFRVALDVIAHFWVSARLIGGFSEGMLRLLSVSAGCLLVLCGCMLVDEHRIAVLVSILCLFGSLSWLFLLDDKERLWVRDVLAPPWGAWR